MRSTPPRRRHHGHPRHRSSSPVIWFAVAGMRKPRTHIVTAAVLPDEILQPCAATCATEVVTKPPVSTQPEDPDPTREPTATAQQSTARAGIRLRRPRPLSHPVTNEPRSPTRIRLDMAHLSNIQGHWPIDTDRSIWRTWIRRSPAVTSLQDLARVL